MENWSVCGRGVVDFDIIQGQNISPSKLLKGVRSEFHVGKCSEHVVMRLWHFRVLPFYLNLNLVHLLVYFGYSKFNNPN